MPSVDGWPPEWEPTAEDDALLRRDLVDAGVDPDQPNHRFRAALKGLLGQSRRSERGA